mmetsp:Transcript_88922/g.226285  ORF Transcript_88922/g.226285 Transcript_88922/m.226285 type:complete len:398 (-) Transcript_88922:63-1256(-)
MATGWSLGIEMLLLAVLVGVLACYFQTREQALESRLVALEQANAELREGVSSASTSAAAVPPAWAPEAAGLLYAPSAPLEFAMVSDLDKDSRDPKRLLWHSHLRRGSLVFEPGAASSAGGRWRIEWRPGTQRLESGLAAKNRSLELSELVRFGGRLLTVCDSTGLVFEVSLAKGKAFQRTALADGNGYSTKPFKAEWATVKDGRLLVGSMGREWVAEDGTIEHFDPQWVKSIDKHGRVTSVNWRPIYQALRTVTNTTLPGYLWHEAIEWDPRLKRWLVLPRKASEHEQYTPESDETRGTNMLLVASEDFSDIEVHRVGPMEPGWGFTALRKVPGSAGMYLALKAFEVDGRTETRIALFDLGGPSGSPRLLLDPPFQAVGDAGESAVKYEGLEFLHDG